MAKQPMIAATAALQASLVSTNICLDFFEGDDIEFYSSSEDLGRVGASVSMHGTDLVIHSLRKRVRAGADARFQIGLRVRQEPDSCTEASIQGVARVLRAEIELVSGGLPTPLDFYVALAAGGEVPGGCIDLVVTVPGDAAWDQRSF
jgi:hypothetical protein